MFLQPEWLRSYVLGRLKSLRRLNGTPVTPEESALALRQIVTAHLSLSTLLPHSHTNPRPPLSLSLDPIATALARESRWVPEYTYRRIGKLCGLS